MDWGDAGVFVAIWLVLALIIGIGLGAILKQRDQ